MSDWANLPVEILRLIVQRLEYMEDFFSFGVVCKPWKSTTTTFEKIPSLPLGFPLVLLPAGPVDNYIYWNMSLGVGGMYTLSTLKTYELELPEAMGKKCLGTVRGWLLTVDLELNAELLHPFSRQQIPLPSLLAFKDEFREHRNCPHPLQWVEVKLAMSRNPLDENTSKKDCIVVVNLLSRCAPLLFARLGDQRWTRISNSCDDLSYYKGVLYRVSGSTSALFICDIFNNEAARKAVTAPIEAKRIVPYANVAAHGAQRYLVESSGELLLVSRLYQNKKNPSRLAQKLISRNPFTYSATGFMVHKLEQEESGSIGGFPYRWKEVTDLGGRTLFVGGNASVSSCSSKHVKPDCIYFSTHEQEMYNFKGGWNMGIFNMINNTIELLDYPSELRVPNPPVFYV